MRGGNVAEIEKATMAARDAFRAGGTWAAGAKEVPLNPTPALQQRTPEQQQMLLGQMRERGAGIRSNLEEQSRNRYYSFRQDLEERTAQEALSTERGRTPQVARGATALGEAERWKQAQSGRNPMSREPLVFGSGGPQPAQTMAPQATQIAEPPPFLANRFMGTSSENPLAFTPFGRTIGESPYRTPEIPEMVESPFPRNLASSLASPFGIPRFPYLGV